MVHWIFEIANSIEERARTRGKRSIVLNGGLSVSGLQHIGRLRGEVLIGEAVRKILEKKGFEVKQLIVLYTQDAWKGKEKQLKQFKDNEGEKYIGHPLIRVPDPMGCHANWVEHYWEDFGGVLNKFSDGKIEIVKTTDMYGRELKSVMKEFIEKREITRSVVNKYRGRNPYPEDWIPVEPICERCGRIDTTKSLKVDGEVVEYKCKNCGYHGFTKVENGKLNWRLEWAGVWKALAIDFEPFGKDHATPGGSRDSCVELARTVLNIDPPIGLPYEWVAIRINGKEMDMGSSDFIGITPKEWLEVAHAEVLRYIYFSVPPKKRIVIDLSEIPQYYEQYFKGERAFYAKKEGNVLTEEEEEASINYEFSLLQEAQEKMPFQLPYYTAALLVQSLPKGNYLEAALRRLQASKIITEELTDFEKKRIGEMLEKAGNWVSRYAPEQVKFSVDFEVSPDIVRSLKFRDSLVELGKRLLTLDMWSEEEIKRTMIEYTSDMNTEERKEFYREFYLVMVGKESGPRAAPLLAALGKDMVRKKLIEKLETN
ncbi:MAG: lysine--tRNA ligase [Fervidicoccaceae archaeon]